MSRKWLLVAALSSSLAIGVAACGDDDESNSSTNAGSEVSGTIRIDGSSTVAPLTQAAAELFKEENDGVDISVGTSGTGGGFEKFCAGETDISNASRPIKDEEIEACRKKGVSYDELTVSNDALTVVVNPENPVTCLTVDQVKSIWNKGSNVSSWGDVEGLKEDFGEDLDLYGPGTDSGTFDYFTEAINGEEGVQRTKYNNVGEDDNATVTGVAGSKGGMGYFGFSFFEENADKLKALEIDGGDGCVAPSKGTVQDASYKPLGRQLFVYPSAESLKKPAVEAFVKFYVENEERINEAAQFIPLTDEQQQESLKKIEGLASASK